ncbi:MAG TPA: hypothetical protein DEO65_05825 [Bacillus bacterium]|nr:hypothetical protein [Bacillus sp. (in: firmicutes)]
MINTEKIKYADKKVHHFYLVVYFFWHLNNRHQETDYEFLGFRGSGYIQQELSDEGVTNKGS